MPTYDYICDGCQHEFEAFESIKADPQKICPACQEATLRRKLGPGAAILFKGSGFYQTDYRSDSYKQAAKADTSGSGGSSKPDAAAAAKPEPSKPSTGSGSGATP